MASQGGIVAGGCYLSIVDRCSRANVEGVTACSGLFYRSLVARQPFARKTLKISNPQSTLSQPYLHNVSQETPARKSL